MDYTVTFPEGWTVEYGHLFLKDSENPDGFGFYAVEPDEIYADACEGSNGQLEEVGPSVDDLTTALLQQSGPKTGSRSKPRWAAIRRPGSTSPSRRGSI